MLSDCEHYDATAMSKPHGHSIDDYLEAIHLLVSPIGVYEPAKAPAAIAARVAEALGVSRTAVGEMLKRLTAEGLLERGGGRELVLTPEGTARAEQVDPPQPDRRALPRRLPGLRHGGGARARRRASAPRSPTTWSSACTRSSAIPSAARTAGRSPRDRSARRAASWSRWPTCGKGDSGEIVRQSEQDGGLLSWFEAEGLEPGAKVEVRDIQPAAGHRKIEIGGDEQFIADRAARGLYVRREPRDELALVKAPLLRSGRLLDVAARLTVDAASQAATTTLLNCYLREGGTASSTATSWCCPGSTCAPTSAYRSAFFHHRFRGPARRGGEPLEPPELAELLARALDPRRGAGRAAGPRAREPGRRDRASSTRAP